MACAFALLFGCCTFACPPRYRGAVVGPGAVVGERWAGTGHRIHPAMSAAISHPQHRQDTKKVAPLRRPRSSRESGATSMPPVLGWSSCVGTGCTWSSAATFSWSTRGCGRQSRRHTVEAWLYSNTHGQSRYRETNRAVRLQRLQPSTNLRRGPGSCGSAAATTYLLGNRLLAAAALHITTWPGSRGVHQQTPRGLS